LLILYAIFDFIKMCVDGLINVYGGRQSGTCPLLKNRYLFIVATNENRFYILYKIKDKKARKNRSVFQCNEKIWREKR